jgi:hypothetical protein
MWRKTLLMILKTPYGIGFLVAFILNLIIPKDKEDKEAEETMKATEGSLSTA